MIDQNSQFFAILTNVGAAKQANADALGVAWKITHMGVGDANNTDPQPSAAQKHLINEWRRAPVNTLKIDPVNSAIIVAEQVIPADVGGRWIREIGLYDADGDLVAVANCAPTFKPLLNQGSGRTQIIRLNLLVSSTSNVELRIDPSVVLATRKYVDDSIIDVVPADKRSGTYTKVKVNSRGVVTSGSNPTTLGGYGITDAMMKGEGGVGTVAPLADKLWAVPSTSFFTATNTTDDRPAGVTHAAGVHIKYPEDAYAIDFLGGIDAEYFGVRRVDHEGRGPWRTLWHSGNFAPDDYARKSRTLEGYGIHTADQEEAEAGVNDTKPMTSLRVAQAVAKLVVGARETVMGVAKIATQAKTNEGVDDRTFVTPKKLCWGFNSSFQLNGYVVFPTWLGGFIIQWGSITLGTRISTAAINVRFPLAFPEACYQVTGTIGVSNSSYDVSPSYRVNRQQLSLGIPSTVGCVGQAFMDNNPLDTRVVRWFALGR